ncbi:hypothetical protein LIER_24471 [Lithospermum erythrorhizon]|uniref:Uncharacterized protein n=1 Tax=Lithospermum erythrorhizon TaxID=34254 RepID=A0AAV3R717_LITER
MLVLSGGITILWRWKKVVQVISRDDWYVETLVMDEANQSWNQIFIYASCDEKKCGDQLNRLQTMNDVGELGRVMIGDINDILSNEEKEGGNTRSEGSMAMFRDFVRQCGLLDLGFSGHPFMWWNKSSGIDTIKIRLDRVLCDP